MKTLLLLTLLAFTSSGFAARNDCTPNLIGDDICKRAKAMSEELAPSLPQQISDGVFIHSTMAVKTNWIMTMRLGKTKEEYEKIYQGMNLSLSEYDNFLKGIPNTWCQKGSTVRAFIELGGVVTIRVLTSDLKHYFTMSKDNCLIAYDKKWEDLLKTLDTLSPKEKKSVVLLARGRSNMDGDKNLMPHMETKRGWVLETLARNNYYMTELSKYVKWDAMAKYYAVEAENSMKLAKAHMTMAEYLKQSKINAEAFGEAIKEIKESEVSRQFSLHKDKFNKISDYIIKTSKVDPFK